MLNDERRFTATPLPDPVPASRLMRVQDAAYAAGMNAETIRRRIRSGVLRAWGRPARVLLADLLPPYVVEKRKK